MTAVRNVMILIFFHVAEVMILKLTDIRDQNTQPCEFQCDSVLNIYEVLGAEPVQILLHLWHSLGHTQKTWENVFL